MSLKYIYHTSIYFIFDVRISNIKPIVNVIVSYSCIDKKHIARRICFQHFLLVYSIQLHLYDTIVIVFTEKLYTIDYTLSM